MRTTIVIESNDETKVQTAPQLEVAAAQDAGSPAQQLLGLMDVQDKQNLLTASESETTTAMDAGSPAAELLQALETVSGPHETLAVPTDATDGGRAPEFT